MYPIKCVAFDAVGTLIFADPPVWEVYARVGRAYGSQLSQREVAGRFQFACQRSDPAKPHGGREAGLHSDGLVSDRSERDQWRRIVADVLDDVTESDACFETLFEHFGRPEAWRCYEDVAGTLSELKSRGYQLWVASNFDKRLNSVRQGLGELQHIDGCVVSSLIGFRKPDRRFYETLLEKAGCRPDELLMVGDHYEFDVLGARRAGIPALRLNRTSRADLSEISSLSGVVGYLASANAGTESTPQQSQAAVPDR